MKSMEITRWHIKNIRFVIMDIKQYDNMMTNKVNKQKYTEAPMLFTNLLKIY